MDPYSLTAVIVIAIAVVLIVFSDKITKASKFAGEQVGKTASDTAERAKQTVVETAAEVGGTIRYTVDKSAEALAPVIEAAANFGNALSDKLRCDYRELERLGVECNRLSLELERVRAMRINVSFLEAELKLAVLKIPFKYQDFVLKTVRVAEKTKLKQKEVVDYLGLYSAEYVQHVGVDLTVLRFNLLDSGIVQVSGLGTSEVIGNKGQTKLIHSELRAHFSEGTLSSDRSELVKGDPDLLLKKHMEEQRMEVEAKVASFKPVGEVDLMIEKLALEFLRTCFGAAGYRVEKSKECIEKGKSFYQVCEEVNARTESVIALKMSEVKLLTEKKEALVAVIDSQLNELRRLPQKLELNSNHNG